eukprot:scaffold4451_cov60-Phaeocystis_antarctica.AAC.1
MFAAKVSPTHARVLLPLETPSRPTCYLSPTSVLPLALLAPLSLLEFELTPLVRASTSTQECDRWGTPSSGLSNHRKRTGGRMEPRGATWG